MQIELTPQEMEDRWRAGTKEKACRECHGIQNVARIVRPSWGEDPRHSGDYVKLECVSCGHVRLFSLSRFDAHFPKVEREA